jgi:murein DD-endopeptidase MepM/ murein hydrolase activator NlpD
MRKILLSFIILLSVSNFLSAKTYHWRKGTTFLSFLRNHGISQKVYYDLDSDDKELLAEIRAGQSYTIKKGKRGTTILIPVTDELQVKVVKRSKKRSKISFEPIPFEVLKGSIHLTVKKSIFKELYKKTHSRGLIKSLKRAYSNKNLNKMKKGDTLTIFYEQKRRKGKATSNPKILASLITINKKRFYSYLADDGKYYDSLGKEYRTVKKSFAPYQRPVSRCRVSSSFTHRRFHPILKRYKAHLGVDYAARTGTPIKATAKGRILSIGRKGGYGKCITIQHSNGLKSLYAHMSRFKKGLKAGSRVSQGTVIGYVGSTGRSTGPHLHFGMYKNGRAINPAKYVRFRKTETIVKRLKGKDYRKLRRKVAFYRKKFRRVTRTGGNPIFVKNGKYLLTKREKRS